MMRVVLSLQADADLREIWTYSAETWDRAQADAYINGLRGTLDKVRRGVITLRGDPALPPVYRSLHHKRRVILLRMDVNDLRVIRILHDRMDPGRHLGDKA